jgi:hypothetical protein
LNDAMGNDTTVKVFPHVELRFLVRVVREMHRSATRR